MIDAMFQAGTDAALDDQIARPKPFQPEAPSFSFTGLGRGAARGIGGAAANTIAFGADIAGAFGETSAATGAFGGGGMFSTQTPEERKQAEEARRKLLANEDTFSSEGGDIFRERARDIMPDPQSTHASEQVVAGITQFAAQAVGYSLATGPAAPFLLAGDVGLAEADKLKQQGVDLETRTKAGAVAGVVAGASIAVPVAVPGSVAKTTAAVIAGGPGGFIAQNAAERAIIENGGYEKIASTYDPFDPVGLALSTIVPAGFGAYAVRGARAAARAKPAPSLHEVVLGLESGGQRFGKDGRVLTSPKGAKGEMQVMDATNLDPGFGVRPAADNSLAERARVGRDYLDAMLARYGGDEAKAMAAYNAGPGALDAALKKGGNWLDHLPAETQTYVTNGMRRLGGDRTAAVARRAAEADPDVVAAARVRQTLNAIESYKLTPDGDIAGATAHIDAMETAHAQLARGEPVSVSDLLALDSVRTGRLLDDMIAAGEEQRASLLPEAGNLADAGQVRALRAELDQLRASRPDDSPAAVKARAKELQDGEQLSYKRALSRAEKEFSQRLETHDAQIQRVSSLLDRNARAQRAVDQVGRLDSELTDLRAQRGEVDAPASSPRRLAMALNDVFQALPQRALTAVEAAPARPKATGKQLFDAAGESPLSGARPADGPPAAPARPGEGGAPDAAATAALDRQSTEIADLNPEMMVQLEGREPMTVADLLEAVKKEASDETRDASLIDVAANCFLRSA